MRFISKSSNRGNSLFMVMILIIIFSIILSNLLSDVMSKQSDKSFLYRVQAKANAMSGLQHFKKSLIESTTPIILPIDSVIIFTDKSHVSVTAKKQDGYIAVSASGSYQNVTYELSKQLGQKRPTTYKTPLLLLSPVKKLTLSGRTSIVGNIGVQSNPILDIYENSSFHGTVESVKEYMLTAPLLSTENESPSKETLVLRKYSSQYDTLNVDTLFIDSCTFNNVTIQANKHLNIKNSSLNNVKLVSKGTCEIFNTSLSGTLILEDSTRITYSQFPQTNLFANNAGVIILEDISEFEGACFLYGSPKRANSYIIHRLSNGNGLFVSNTAIIGMFKWLGTVIAPSIQTIEGEQNRLHGCVIKSDSTEKTFPIYSAERALYDYVK